MRSTQLKLAILASAVLIIRVRTGELVPSSAAMPCDPAIAGSAGRFRHDLATGNYANKKPSKFTLLFLCSLLHTDRVLPGNRTRRLTRPLESRLRHRPLLFAFADAFAPGAVAAGRPARAHPVQQNTERHRGDSDGENRAFVRNAHLVEYQQHE